MDGHVFNPPPGWPTPPANWRPPSGWKPDPSWPPPPPDWALWIPVSPLDGDDVEREQSATSAGPLGESLSHPLPLSDTASSAHTAVSLPTPPLATPIGDDGQSADSLLAEVKRLRVEVRSLRAQTSQRADDLVDLDDERVLQSIGIYNYHHPLENAAQYQDRLRIIQQSVKDMVKLGDAILASDMFTYNNSLVKGRKMTSDFSKLMLRAYNSEADNCVRVLRAGNILTARKRLDRAVESIAKLGSMMEMRVNPEYHALRLEELELTADYLMKVQEEKEAAREERERLREERRAEQELKAQRERLEKERSHYLNALEALRSNDDVEAIAEMEQRLKDVDEVIVQNDYRTANIRAGYVYVISNPGSFGKRMVKIGMTRRLEPMDRVRELGDASVPFPFDVHAVFFADDAVAVENELHKAFAEVRVNRVNERREFFFATPHEVREVLAEKLGNLLEFTEQPEATQYLQSRKYWPADITTGSRESVTT